MSLSWKCSSVKSPGTLQGQYLTCLMNRLCHPQHQPCSGTLFIPLFPSKLLRRILPFTKFAMPNESCPKVSISNGVIFIAKVVGFMKNTHPPRAIPIEPYVHWLSKCIKKTGWVLICIAVIPCIMQLTNFEELVLKFMWIIVGESVGLQRDIQSL